MTILAVDDERLGLEALTEAIKQSADQETEVEGFRDPQKALEFAEKEKPYAAFLDIFMPVMSGIELAKAIKIASPSTHIIFATGFDEYMGDAFSLHANGYILKPITAAKVRSELENLKTLHSEYSKKINTSGKRLRLQCFGNFEAYADGIPMEFKYDKTKEMLAYITSRRGALCTNDEICINIWEDDARHDSYLRGIRKDLMDVLKSLDLGDVIYQQRGKIGLNCSKVSCDYYDFINGDTAAINSYQGEFMVQYSWGEMINAEMIMGRK